jgi:hypothetical protein
MRRWIHHSRSRPRGSGIGGEGLRHPTAHGGEANHWQFAQSADGLDPAKALLDALAYLDACRIPLATRSTPIDGAALALGMAGDVWLDAARVERPDEAMRVVVFLKHPTWHPPQRHRWSADRARHPSTGSTGKTYVHRLQQAVSVLDEGTGQVAELSCDCPCGSSVPPDQWSGRVRHCSASARGSRHRHSRHPSDESTSATPVLRATCRLPKNARR